MPSKVNIESGSARSGSARSGSARSGSARSGWRAATPCQRTRCQENGLRRHRPNLRRHPRRYCTDDAGTYLSLFNIDPAYRGRFVFQVFVTKPLTSFMTDQNNQCSAFNWTEGALVGHISDPNNPLVSGSARSGSARSGSARSGSARSAIPSDGDPLVQNTAFTLASSTVLPSSEISAASTQVSAAAAGTGCRIDECTLAAPRLPNEATILVRAYRGHTHREYSRWPSVRPGWQPDGHPDAAERGDRGVRVRRPELHGSAGSRPSGSDRPSSDARLTPQGRSGEGRSRSPHFRSRTRG